jgi:hypothetical protein
MSPVDAPLFRLPVEPSEPNGLDQLSFLMVDKVTTMPRGNLRDHTNTSMRLPVALRGAATVAVRKLGAELAIAAAELDGHTLAARTGLIREAAADVTRTHPSADADDVLLWAEARASASA